MPTTQSKNQGFSKANPFRVHIENSSQLMSVFIVRPDQYKAALERHSDMADLVSVTWGTDSDIFDKAFSECHSLIGYRFPKDQLRERAPHLKWVQVLGAGVDYLLPLDWLPPDLQITTNWGAHLPKAGESALMAVLAIHAQLPRIIGTQRTHQWNRASRIFTSTVKGKTILIVGVGHIGGAAADHVKRLGMNVIGMRRSGKLHPSVDEMHGPDALHKLLPRADIVLLNTALTSATRFIMGEKEFALMKRGAGFINMSRGGLVDPKALEDALKSDHLSGALIDVSYPEPLPPDASLWDAPNLIITPHVLSDDIDNYVPQTFDVFFNNLRRYMNGEPLLNLVEVTREY